MTEKIRNISDLRKKLCRVIEKIESGGFDLGEAAETSNAAGKIHAGLKIQIEAFAIQGKKDFKIPFLVENVKK